MFSFLHKKQMDKFAAEHFWNWFQENESWIIERVTNHGMEVVTAIDSRLTPIFPYCKRELEFQLGFNDGKGEFFFFHFNDKTLIRDGKTLGEMMPAALCPRWRFILEA